MVIQVNLMKFNNLFNQDIMNSLILLWTHIGAEPLEIFLHLAGWYMEG